MPVGELDPETGPKNSQTPFNVRATNGPLAAKLEKRIRDAGRGPLLLKQEEGRRTGESKL